MEQASVETGEDVYIGAQCVLGAVKEVRIRKVRDEGSNRITSSDEIPPQVVIDDGSIIMNQVVIFEGTHVGARAFVQDQCRIGYGCCIGDGCRLQYGTYVCDRVTIGSDSIVAGFVCDGASIGEQSTVMGVLIHQYTEPHRGWWESNETPPTIKNDVVVGYNATVVGGVTIGHHSYIAAGATVTEDVPPKHVVTGVDSHTHLREWSGEQLPAVIDEWLSSDDT